jgi:endonuclease YncB( thermonuclease family)
MRNLIIFSIAVSAHLLLWHGATLAAEINVIDGDRFVMPDGELVRVTNIRTPSVDDGADCLIERQTGEKTIARVKELFAECPPVLDRLHRDSRGRTEARVEVCGRDLGDVLVREGLAIFRDSPEDWCRGRSNRRESN